MSYFYKLSALYSDVCPFVTGDVTVSCPAPADVGSFYNPGADIWQAHPALAYGADVPAGLQHAHAPLLHPLQATQIPVSEARAPVTRHPSVVHPSLAHPSSALPLPHSSVRPSVRIRIRIRVTVRVRIS